MTAKKKKARENPLQKIIAQAGVDQKKDNPLYFEFIIIFILGIIVGVVSFAAFLPKIYQSVIASTPHHEDYPKPVKYEWSEITPYQRITIGVWPEPNNTSIKYPIKRVTRFQDGTCVVYEQTDAMHGQLRNCRCSEVHMDYNQQTRKCEQEKENEK